MSGWGPASSGQPGEEGGTVGSMDVQSSKEEILRQRLQTGFLGIIAFALVMIMLVQARFILISLAIAIILFALTSDAINAISSRLKVPNWLATTLALAGIALGLLWVSTTIVAQMNEVVVLAISYAERVQTALSVLTERFGADAQDRVMTFLTTFNITGWLRSLASQASGLISGSILVILFVAFMFAERVWFPAKIERLTGSPQQALNVRQIIASIIHRVNRYLVIKTAVSLVTAGLIWLIFVGFGLEMAAAVALLTFVLNFIPSVGSIIATVIAIALCYVLTGDPATTLIVGGLCTAVQFIIGNIIDPMLMGQTLRVSSFGIILSLAFWGAIWGVAGMFLAVPIMVAMMIICAHIPWLRPLAIMLSREGTLPELEDSPEQNRAV